MKNKTIITELTTLQELFTKRRFRVPDYQRGYAWGETQVKALLEDLDNLTLDSPMHYTGTLVLVESEDQPYKPNYTCFDIVDGQQRLTTLVILLSVLLEQGADLPNREILKKLYEVDGDVTSSFIAHALRLNNTLEKSFRTILKDGKLTDSSFLSERRLQDARKMIEEWVKDKKFVHGFVTKTIQLVTTKLGILVYCPQNSEEAGMMFEVINNRGKPLSELEKVKNYLIYYAVKTGKKALRESIDEHWGDILKNLSLAHSPGDYDRQNLLRAVAVFYLGHRKTESNASYKTLKNRFPIDSRHINDDVRDLADFVDVLKECSGYYEMLFHSASKALAEYPKHLRKQVELIRAQTSHMSILPLFLWGFWAHKRKIISEEQLVLLLEYLEKLNFRVYMAPSGAGRADSGFGELFIKAHKLFKNKNFKGVDQLSEAEDGNERVIQTFGDLLQAIEKFTVESRRGGSLESLVSSLAFDKKRNFDAYKGWSRGNRYFLFNYECSLDTKRSHDISVLHRKRKEGETNDYASIEHLWAQNYPELLSDGDEKLQKGRLANLVWLEMGVNIAASDKSIEDKIQEIHDKANTEKGSTSLMIGRVRKALIKVVCETFGLDKQTSTLADCVHTASKLEPDEKYKLYVKLLGELETPMLNFARKRWAFPNELKEIEAREAKEKNGV